VLLFNWTPRHEGLLGEWRYSSTHSLTSVLDGGEWSASCPGRFTPRYKEPLIPTGYEAVWAPEPFCTRWKRSIQISYHIRLDLPTCLFPSGFPTTILHALLISPVRATFPTHLILLEQFRTEPVSLTMPMIQVKCRVKVTKLHWKSGWSKKKWR
jgi:hypothetical protein